MHVQTLSGTTGVGRAAFPALLLERSLVSRSDLSTAQRHADREHIELAEALVALGFVAEGACYSLVAEAAGLTLVDLAGSASSELAVRLVPERLARRHIVVPLSRGQPDADLCDQPSVRPGGRTRPGVRVRPAHAAVGCAAVGVLEALERCYPKLRELDVLAARLSGETPWSRARKTAVDLTPAISTVIDLCNHIIGRAVEVGASDVHVECGAAGTTVRYRICGVLEPVLTLPAVVSHNRSAIVSRSWQRRTSRYGTARRTARSASK